MLRAKAARYERLSETKSARCDVSPQLKSESDLDLSLSSPEQAQAPVETLPPPATLPSTPSIKDEDLESEMDVCKAADKAAPEVDNANILE